MDLRKILQDEKDIKQFLLDKRQIKIDLKVEQTIKHVCSRIIKNLRKTNFDIGKDDTIKMRIRLKYPYLHKYLLTDNARLKLMQLINKEDIKNLVTLSISDYIDEDKKILITLYVK